MDKGLRKNLGKFLIFLGIVTLFWASSGPEGFFGRLLLAALLIIYGIGLNEETQSEQNEKMWQLKATRETNARAKIRNIFEQAGNNTPAEVEEKAKLAETLLKQGESDWTMFGPTKISEIIQGVEALKGKK